MDTETSSFETSEMLAAFIASTPLLEESWRLCQVANTTAPGSFVVDEVRGVTYVAFSGIQMVSGWDPSCLNLVPLPSVDVTGNRVFYPLARQYEEEEAVSVHSGMLNLFSSFYMNPSFKTQMSTILSNRKSIVITGHSIGATVASLTTLWLLSYLQTISSRPSVLCITFGSLLLGNESLSRATLREQWAGNFCHIVGKHDMVPRLLLTPLASFIPQLNFLTQFWQLSMVSSASTAFQLPDQEKDKLFFFILNSIGPSTFWPFGNYLVCSEHGAICVDNSAAIVKMMQVLFKTGSPTSAIEDHLKYGYYVEKVSTQFLYRRSFMGSEEFLSEKSYEAGLYLALQASGISCQASDFGLAKDCLTNARRMGLKPTLKSAALAIRLSEINPYRAQIAWYKDLCDKADNQLGYYDSFKSRGASKRETKINMNRIKLGRFWDNLIEMLDNNELPHNFHRRTKWINASQFYKLLVEPLDIADYYRTGMHRSKGHYIQHGRERRYQIFDKWWSDRIVSESEKNRRTKFASSTQDTVFWARVEEAREWLDDAKSEHDAGRLTVLWNNLVEFEIYAGGLVEHMEVSKDVLARKSSYSLWVEEWGELKTHLRQHLDGNVVP